MSTDRILLETNQPVEYEEHFLLIKFIYLHFILFSAQFDTSLWLHNKTVWRSQQRTGDNNMFCCLGNSHYWTFAEIKSILFRCNLNIK